MATSPPTRPSPVWAWRPVRPARRVAYQPCVISDRARARSRVRVWGALRARERRTADVSVLIPVIDRLRSCFGIGRVCVVADRGMISAPTIAALEDRGLEYVLGARERTDSLVRTVVLADQKPFTPLCVQRAGGAETQLFIKEVKTEGRRYIVCRNEAE